MTQATICDGKCGEIVIELTGHADYNPGNDVVCAAISTFTYALINLVRAAEKQGEATIYELIEDSGHIKLRFRHKQWQQYKRFYLTGMYMIADHYPKHLEVHEL